MVDKKQKYGLQHRRNSCTKLSQIPLGGETRQTSWSHSPSQFERNTVYKKREIQLSKKINTIVIVKYI